MGQRFVLPAAGGGGARSGTGGPDPGPGAVPVPRGSATAGPPNPFFSPAPPRCARLGGGSTAGGGGEASALRTRGPSGVVVVGGPPVCSPRFAAARRAAVLKRGGAEPVLGAEPRLETSPQPPAPGWAGARLRGGPAGGCFPSCRLVPYSQKVPKREPRGFQKEMEKELRLVLLKISDPGALRRSPRTEVLGITRSWSLRFPLCLRAARGEVGGSETLLYPNSLRVSGNRSRSSMANARGARRGGRLRVRYPVNLLGRRAQPSAPRWVSGGVFGCGVWDFGRWGREPRSQPAGLVQGRSRACPRSGYTEEQRSRLTIPFSARIVELLPRVLSVAADWCSFLPVNV